MSADIIIDAVRRLQMAFAVAGLANPSIQLGHPDDAAKLVRIYERMTFDFKVPNRDHMAIGGTPILPAREQP